LIVTCKTLQNF